MKNMSISRALCIALFITGFLFASVSSVHAQRSAKVQRALNLIEYGNPEEAIAEAMSAVNANAKDHEAWAALGIAYLENGNMAEAEKAVAKAFDLERKNGLVRISRGKLFGKRGNIKDALEEFNLALKYDKNDLDAFLALSRYYLTIDSMKSAEVNLYRAQSANPNDVRPYIGLGEFYEKQKVVDLAVKQFEEAKKLNPNDVTVRAKLAQLYLRRRKYTESVNEWIELMRIDSTYKRGYYEIANLFLIGEQFANAASFAEKYVLLEPNDLKGQWLLARALSENNEPEKAVKSLEYVAEHSDSLKPLTTLYLARGYVRSKDYPKAIEIYKYTNKLEPDDLYYWGYALISTGDTLGGVDKWKLSLVGDTIRTEETRARVRNSVIAIYQGSGRFEMAGDFLSELAAKEQSDTNYVKAGQLYLAGGNLPKAEGAFNQSLSRNQNSLYSLIGLIDISAKRLDEAAIKQYLDRAEPMAQTAGQKNTLGEALGRSAFAFYGEKDYKKSIDWFSKSALLLSKESKYVVNVHVGWGSALTQIKQFDKAKDVLTKAKALDPDNADVKNLLKFLADAGKK
jgi:tetratricopeptide (TPR) repeat protein